MQRIVIHAKWRCVFGGLAMVLLTSGIPLAGAETSDAAGQRLVDKINARRGLCVLLGEGLGPLAVRLAQGNELTFFVQSKDSEDVAAARRVADEAGLLGARVYVEQGTWSRIHLADHLADGVLATGSAAAADGVPQAELLRIVHPGGVILGRGEDQFRPAIAGAGQWTHPYHGADNNPQADDTVARGPFLTHYLAQPWYGPMPEVTVSAGGRLFKAFGHISFKEREWPLLSKLLAVNAYNGSILWERDLTPGFMIHRNTIVATPDLLYLADNDSCKRIDTATGKIQDEIVVPADVAEGSCWKWMALEGDVLYALLGPREPEDKVLRGTRTQSGWPWSSLGDMYANPEYPWGFGKTVVAIDVNTKNVLWSRREDQLIDSRALCMSTGRMFLYSQHNYLSAVEAKTGKTLWSTSSTEILDAIGNDDKAQQPRRGYSSQTFAKSTDRAIYFAGPQRTRLVAVSAEDGRLMWTLGDEGNYQLVIRPEGLYAMGRTTTSKKLDPVSGKILAELECLRGNCTRATGTVESIFARGDSHTGTLQLSVGGDESRRISVMRPACQDGVIAANGYLYWGPWMCDCNHSLVGCISLGPAGDFNFTQDAKESERLEVTSESAAAFPVDQRDWPTYRANNSRTAHTQVVIPGQVELRWQFTPRKTIQPTAPVAAGDRIFVAGSDGIVRSFDAADGRLKWTAYTGGPVRYPPSVASDRVYVGSGDGWVYALEATSGQLLWRFRAAPQERKIPVYGNLASTWPVNTGVLVEDGVAYAAAGIASHDGTHVYALDALTGKIRWQNNTSSRLMGDDIVCGVSVQGHLLLDQGKLYMPGGNVVSPAIYDAATGKCLNTLTDQWQKAPRGSELFLVNGQVAVTDQMIYSPREYIPSRYFAKYLLQASYGDVAIQGTDGAMMRVDPRPGPDGKPQVLWQETRFISTAAVVLAQDTVLAAGMFSPAAGEKPAPTLVALDAREGKTLWQKPLAMPVAPWGLAVDREGRVLVTLDDGRVLCFAK